MGECLNLIAEIARKRPKIEYQEIAKELGINEKTLRNKISGVSDFTWKETSLIQKKFFPDLDKEYLFERSGDKPA